MGRSRESRKATAVQARKGAGRSQPICPSQVAGTTAIREGSRLERAFRDVYTGTQHAFISEKVAIDSAQVWLGVIEDHFSL